MKKEICSACGFLYEEAKGVFAASAAPETPGEIPPEGRKCPRCGAEKAVVQAESTPNEPVTLSAMETAAVCSNLARGCEKQYLPEAAGLFAQLAAFFTSAAPKTEPAGFGPLAAGVLSDMESALPAAKAQAEANADRGALRALTWADKVTRIQKSLLNRYEKQGEALYQNQNVYVCTICGFIAVGDAPPALCPVCKAPDWKFEKEEGR